MSTENTQNTDAAPVETETAAEPAEVVAPAEGVAAEGEKTEVAPAAVETPEAKAEAEEAKHKRAGGWQRKIERLERELAEVRAGRTQPAPTTPAAPKTAQDAAAEYIAAQVERQLAEREAQREKAAAEAAFAARTQEVRSAHPDFDDVIASVDVPVSPAVQEALLTSKHGPDLIYLLATDQAELARISALPPLAAAREVGRLEAKLASVTAAPKAPAPVALKPAAPAPITPVTARGPTTIKSPDSMSYEEYVAYRDNQRKR